MKAKQSCLVGDGIETPGNAVAMLHAARMYGIDCRFRDTKELQESEELRNEPGAIFSVVDSEEIGAAHSQVLAVDNLPGASEIYSFSAGEAPAIVVGNERRGLSHGFRDLATAAVQIPMISRRINCLNVAAASAVAIHYLCHARVGPMVTRGQPATRRPELLLIGGKDHIELGSSIRSAAAFGWDRVVVEDRDGIWFGCHRVKRSEGRAAARRGRNVIRLVPGEIDAPYHYPEVCVVTAFGEGVPVHRARLDRGARQLIVIPDESRPESIAVARERFGSAARWVRLDLDIEPAFYHYRLVSAVAMAEISRQVGRTKPGRRKRGRQVPVYDRALAASSETLGVDVSLADLEAY